MTTYVLVPGFWLGGWAWDAVTRRLEAAGHWPMLSRPADIADILLTLGG